VAPHAILPLGDPESAATAPWPIPSARTPGVATGGQPDIE
jgi:hypothetical protein